MMLLVQIPIVVFNKYLSPHYTHWILVLVMTMMSALTRGVNKNLKLSRAPHSWGFLFMVMGTGYVYYNLPFIDGVFCLWDDG